MSEDTVLQHAYRELLAARAPAAREGCPAPEALLALVEREGGEAERLGTLDHVMRCGACLPELELLRAATSAATEASEADRIDLAPRRAGRWQPSTARALAMAAGFVVVLGVGVVLRDADGTRERVLRGSSTGITLASPERRADGAVVLRWTRVPDAVRYRVEVYSVQGVTVAQRDGTDSSFVVPPSDRESGGASLRWIVTAMRADGGEVRSLEGRIEP